MTVLFYYNDGRIVARSTQSIDISKREWQPLEVDYTPLEGVAKIEIIVDGN